MEKIFNKTQIKIAMLVAAVSTILIFATAFLTIYAINSQINTNAESDLQKAQSQLVNDLDRNAVGNISVNLQFNNIIWNNATIASQNINDLTYKSQAKPVKDVRKYSIRIITDNGDIEYTSDLFDQNSLDPHINGFSKIETTDVCIFSYTKKIDSGENAGKITQVGEYCQFSAKELGSIYSAISIIALIVAIISYVLAFLLARFLIKPIKKAYQRTQSFGHDLSHEMLTPLTVALSQVQKSLLTREYMQGLESAETNLKGVLNSLDLIKAHSLKHDGSMVREKVDLEVLLKELINANYNDLFSISSTASPLVEADIKLIRHIFENILSNAAKYKSKDSIAEVIITKHKIQIINEIDNPSDIVQNQLFVRGYRGQNAKGMPGMGFGLAIAYELAKDIGWNLTIKLLNNKFTVTILFN